MTSVEIHVLTGVSSGDTFRYRLAIGESIQIGRADSNDLVLSDPRVSRTHCGLLAKEEGLFVYDLGSAAGTVHMGFQLKSGEAGARMLISGDEFKIGDSLFKVILKQDPVVVNNADTEDQGGESKKGILANRKVLLMALVAGLALVALVFLLEPGGPKKKPLPPQRSHIALTLPAYRLLGYWPGSRKTAATNKDTSHIDRVEFLLPASDQLIEFEYLSEAPIRVLLDGVEVDSLPEFSAAWRRRQLLVRDIAQGDERKLIFDNLSFPTKNSSARLKRWAVRNIRVTPITRPIDANFRTVLQNASALANGFDKSPEGIFIMVRALQRVLMELLIDQSVDAAPVTIDRSDNVEGTSALDPATVSETLEAILSERERDYDPEMDARHIQAVSSLIGSFEGELWRRVDSRFRQARHSAEAKNSIVVYDNLVSIKAMFPDETDYRWVRANRMLNDRKLVPKRVLESPGKFRR